VNDHKQPIPVFYCPEQSVPLAVQVSDKSPSSHKPELVVSEAVNRFGSRIEIAKFEPLTRADIKRAHSHEYVDQILDCQTDNGFGNRLVEVAATLPWTTGSLYAAAKHALTNHTMAMSPTSGFHHACYDKAMGFCTFNGLMVALLKLWDEQITRDVKQFGIIDFDAHYGNGTDDIIAKYNIPKYLLVHETFGKYAVKRANYGVWLNILPEYLEEKFRACKLLVYQAGADPHVNDPYGGFLTTDEMMERDQIVFALAKKLNIPIVWNLAGGYQTPIQNVLDLHMNTFEAAFANQF